MVDFDNELTVGLPAVDIERVSVLQRRYEFIEAFEFYKKQKLNNVGASMGLVRARLISFFLQMQGMLRRRYKGDQYHALKDAVFEGATESKILEVFYQLSEDLDMMNLTKIDSRKDVNKEIAKEVNRAMGYR